jgi:hypothetical protein
MITAQYDFYLLGNAVNSVAKNDEERLRFAVELGRTFSDQATFSAVRFYMACGLRDEALATAFRKHDA